MLENNEKNNKMVTMMAVIKARLELSSDNDIFKKRERERKKEKRENERKERKKKGGVEFIFPIKKLFCICPLFFKKKEIIFPRRGSSSYIGPSYWNLSNRKTSFFISGVYLFIFMELFPY